jgi:glucosyl-3-phosphoglycerate synthase
VATTIGGVLAHTVGPLRAAGLVDEVIVVDAASPDGTAEAARRAGARVLQQDALLPEHGPALGKGDAMWRGLSATDADLVCFLDGDTENPDPDHLLGLLGPLLTDSSVAFVKGAFDRPFRTGEHVVEGQGGRVTELMARPLLALHAPALGGFRQPLAGEIGARRDVLCRIPFPVGYGVEIAMLLDVWRDVGLDAMAECWLGRRQNRHQSLSALSAMAYAVLVAAQRRVDPATPLAASYERPGDEGQATDVPLLERPPLDELDLPGDLRTLAGAVRSE